MKILKNIFPKEPFFRILLFLTLFAVIAGVSILYNVGKQNQDFRTPLPESENPLTISEEVDLPEPILSVNKENCDYTSLGEFKVLDIFNDAFITKPKMSYKDYTRVFRISGKIEDGFICIISDVDDDYKGKNAYYFTTFVWFGDEINSGHINTGWSISRNILYDNSTDKSNTVLNGKFFGSETPFKFYGPLSSLIVSDKINGGYKYIYPLQLLQSRKEISIGGFTNDSPHDYIGKIIKFRIFYKGGSIEPVN